jgi:protein phosphatase
MLRGTELFLRTADHTWFGEPYRNQSSVPLDLRHTNVLMRALGSRPEVEATLGSDVLWNRDVFLLCSDGLSSLVSASDIRAQLTACTALSEAGQNLVRIALDAGGKDNISVVLVRVLDV